MRAMPEAELGPPESALAAAPGEPSAAPSASAEPGVPPAWAALLGHFYARLGVPFPSLTRLSGEEVPEPYRRLLVHSNDMTPTLEQFYRRRLCLRVLGRERAPEAYQREVVLQLAGNRRPASYGAICIHLPNLPESARQIVLAETLPFGRILHSEMIAHLSWPQAFFRADADPHMSRLLDVADARVLYGRRNVLVDGQRRLLAEVIEILAPVPESFVPHP